MRKSFIGAVGLAVLGLSSSAMAQQDDSMSDFTPSNIAVRLGVALPLDSQLSNYGSPLIGLGLEYQVSGSFTSSSATYLSLDYMTSSTQFSGGIFPFCVNERFYLGGKRYRRTYAFAGLGGAVVNVNSANVVLAARGGIGADVSDSVFFEASLLLTDRSSGVSGDSVGFYVGYRF